MNYQEKYISAQDDLQLYLRDYQPKNFTGQIVVCLSGLTRNSNDFSGLASRLQSIGHRVICLDYRGRGKSDYDTNWTNYHPKTYASDIFHVLSALNVHGCVMIGTSLGGIMSMVLCISAPGLVRSVILNDVGPDLDEEGLSQIIAYTGDKEPVADLNCVVEKLKKYHQDNVNFSDEDWRIMAEKTHKMEKGHYIPNWDCAIADNLKDASGTEERENLWPLFKSIGKRPTLVLRGKESSVFKQATFKKMLTILPNISGLEIANVGHAPTLEEVDAEKEIIKFLEV